MNFDLDVQQIGTVSLMLVTPITRTLLMFFLIRIMEICVQTLALVLQIVILIPTSRILLIALLAMFHNR